ncbi:uncharacterized protein LOC102801571, partial [Saccoglossus kowalevskii]|uniref:Uncharacterized protein n=1 Tax=Saccoglossus kowalevskii TaxID=10224 RepID=A0ABM0MPM4_SACKO
MPTATSTSVKSSADSSVMVKIQKSKCIDSKQPSRSSSRRSSTNSSVGSSSINGSNANSQKSETNKSADASKPCNAPCHEKLITKRTSTQPNKLRNKSSTTSNKTRRRKRFLDGEQDCDKSSCISAQYNTYFLWYTPYRQPFRRVNDCPRAFNDSYQLQHPDLTEGQKHYLWHTASIYSMKNMKKLQQKNYERVLLKQQDL